MKFLDRIYPHLLLAPTLLPVVIWDGLIYPYLVPKTLVFYALTLISVAVFGILLTHGRAFYFARLRDKITWIPGILLFVAYGTSSIGVDFYRSFWSLFIRGDGLLMLTCVVTSFYLLLLFVDRTFLNRFVRTVAWVATAIALYGIGEWIVSSGDRVGGLLGNAAFFAGYLGIALFITLIGARTYRGSTRTMLQLGAVLQLFAIILSGTRGTLLALLIAGGIYLVTVAVRPRERGVFSRAQKWAIGVLLVGVVSIALLGVFRTHFLNSSFSPLARIANISLQDATVANRLFAWEGMLTEVQKRPWTGVGAEHIDMVFNRIYDPTKITEEWFDRAHNTFIDYLVQYGVFGLGAYLALIGMYLGIARKLYVQGEREVATLLALLAVTYSVQNFFVFDTISSFWLFVAGIAVFLAGIKNDVPHTIRTSPTARLASWGIAGVLIIAIVPVSVRPAIAAYDLAHAYAYQITDVVKSGAYLAHGVAQGTYADVEYAYRVYDMYINVQMDYFTQNEQQENLRIAYHATAHILTDTFYEYSYDGRVALYLAHVLSAAPEGAVADKELLLGALERAIRLSPKRAEAWFVLANLAIAKANEHPPLSKDRVAGYAGAYDLLTQYIALVPEFAVPYFVRADLLYAMGDTERAMTDALLGKELYKSDEETARRAIGFFAHAGMIPEVAFFLEDLAREVPEDLAVRYDLAKARFLLGDKEGALSIVRELRKTDPSILDSDTAFLQAITSYERTK